MWRYISETGRLQKIGIKDCIIYVNKDKVRKNSVDMRRVCKLSYGYSRTNG